jgi:hypothetical protein
VTGLQFNMTYFSVQFLWDDFRVIYDKVGRQGHDACLRFHQGTTWWTVYTGTEVFRVRSGLLVYAYPVIFVPAACEVRSCHGTLRHPCPRDPGFYGLPKGHDGSPRAGA